MREVTDRAQTLLAEADEGRWPEDATHDLLNYLHLEVLRQSGEQEWLVFGAAQKLTDRSAQSAQRDREQIEVRESVEQLTEAVAGGDGVNGMTPQRLAVITRSLLAQLQALLAAERSEPGELAGAPSTASLGAQPHEWYALTEGPAIELDRLRGRQGSEAVMGRLIRLRAGEAVELRSSRDPTVLLARLVGIDHVGYSVERLESGPRLWRVQVVRRA